MKKLISLFYWEDWIKIYVMIEMCILFIIFSEIMDAQKGKRRGAAHGPPRVLTPRQKRANMERARAWRAQMRLSKEWREKEAARRMVNVII